MKRVLAHRLPFVFALLMAASLWLTALPAHAASSSASANWPHHDMSHPAKVYLPCQGEPRAGVGPVPAPHTCKGAVGPYTWGGDPRGSQCVNGVGYLQTENGATSWTNTENNNTVTVQYWWCPAVNSSQYPNGINWAYGTTHPATGCLTLQIGFYEGPGSTNQGWRGAYLHAGGYAEVETDNTDYSAQSWYICTGNYIYDYSLIGDGRYAWKARMSSGDVSSPTKYDQHYSEVESPNYV